MVLQCGRAFAAGHPRPCAPGTFVSDTDEAATLLVSSHTHCCETSREKTSSAPPNGPPRRPRDVGQPAHEELSLAPAAGVGGAGVAAPTPSAAPRSVAPEAPWEGPRAQALAHGRCAPLRARLQMGVGAQARAYVRRGGPSELARLSESLGESPVAASTVSHRAPRVLVRR